MFCFCMLVDFVKMLLYDLSLIFILLSSQLSQHHHRPAAEVYQNMDTVNGQYSISLVLSIAGIIRNKLHESLKLLYLHPFPTF
jgi:hypothetical protein